MSLDKAKVLYHSARSDINNYAFMEYVQFIVLGLIQGIAEWLPVSSEAMVTLAGRFFFGFAYQEALSVAVWLHAGTAVAAIVYFRKEIVEVLRSIIDQSAERTLLYFLLAATAVTGLIAAPLLFIALTIEISDAYVTLAIGVFLILVAYLQRSRNTDGNHEKSLRWIDGVFAGIAQGFAALPGFSRSGLTTAMLLGQQFSLKQAFYLSFLMSIPVTLGVQVVLPLVSEEGGSVFALSTPLILGGFVAAFVGFATIKALMQFAQRVNFFRATLVLGLLIVILGIILLVL